MQVIVTARNCELPADLREVIDERFEHLQRFEPRASRADVVFTAEKKHIRAEALVSVDRAQSIHGEAEGADARSALDRLSEKLGRQLRRAHERHHAHRAPPMDELFGGPEEPEEIADAGGGP